MIPRFVDHYMELLHSAHFTSTIDTLARATERYSLYFTLDDGGERPLCEVLRPLLVGERTYRHICDVASQLGVAMQDALHAVSASPELRRTLRIPQGIEPLLSLDRKRDSFTAVGRFDGMLNAQGEFVCIEFNSEPGTLSPSFEIDQLFAKMPIATAFAKRYPFSTACTYESLIDCFRPASGKARTLAVVQPSPDMAADNRRWIPYLAARGIPVYQVGAEELSYTERAVLIEGTPIDSVIFSWHDLIDPTPELEKLARALSAGIVRPFFGFSHGLLSSNKGIFELFSSEEYEGIFDGASLPTLRKHVPWTRVLYERKTIFHGEEIDLLPFLEKNRGRFVLKPCGGSRAQGVVVGGSCTDEEWSQTLKRAKRTGYVAQEYIPALKATFPTVRSGQVEQEELKFNISPYLWSGNRVAGAFIQPALGPIINQDPCAPLWLVAD